MLETNTSKYFIKPINEVKAKSYIGVEYGLYKYHLDKETYKNRFNLDLQNIHNTNNKLKKNPWIKSLW